MRRLTARGRQGWLTAHIVSAGAWIGIDVVLAVLVFTAMAANDPALESVCYQALRLFAVWPLPAAGLVCLGSGVVLGLGTRYGLVRYWWVAIKLGLNVVLTVLALVALRPAVDEAAVYGRALQAGLPGVEPDLIFPPIVSPTCLVIAVLLSVYKPGGRIRRDPARSRSAIAKPRKPSVAGGKKTR